ncbi:Arm DNA-binding domain-containing protein [Hydrogenophaga palleronii]
MALTDTACKNAKCPQDKPRARLTDSGGLYLEVAPTGGKLWR